MCRSSWWLDGFAKQTPIKMIGKSLRQLLGKGVSRVFHPESERVKDTTNRNTFKNDGTFDGTFHNKLLKT
jgi:hypothetical protein